jgi:hypothetical protein
MGDFNAKVGGNGSKSSVVGIGGLGDANEAGERLLDFCLDHQLVLTSTWFMHHPRRLYTWTSPDGCTKNQIDYIGIAQQWRSCVSNCKTYPGADCDSDHHLLVATLKIRLGKKRKLETPLRLNLEGLYDKAEVYVVKVKNRLEALEMMDEPRSPEELWMKTKEILLDTAKEVVGFKKRVSKKTWISSDTFELINEKREAKHKDPVKYKELKAEVQRRLRLDKQKQIEDMCDELETANRRGNMRGLFQTARTLTQTFQPRLHCIQSASGQNVTDAEGIAERWREYCEELYSDSSGNVEKDWQFEREPPPLRTEVAKAIRDTASGKSTGPDEVPVELFKTGGDTVLDRMHRICVALWETGEWPDDWADSIFITLPKKGDLKQCTNYRTIALVSHASKILLRIILERIRAKTESEVADEQAGFRRGRGTRDQVTNLRIVMQKAREHQQPLYMCFVDFKKAFDSISHERLWITMLEMGYPGHIVNLLARLYRKQKAKVRVAGTLSRGFRVRRGVRQGCVLSPYLFNILAEMVMRETLDGYEGGIQMGGRRVTNLRYADDIILLACTEMELQDLVNRLDSVSKRYSLLINVDKTKTMATNGATCSIQINSDTLEQVIVFPYLGSLITDDSECSKEIHARLAKGRSIGTKLKKIWQNHGIHISTKIRLMKALVWPVALYGCESWTLKKTDEARINAFEMKCLRQLLRVSWTDRKTNEWVLATAGVDRNLLISVKERKLAYFGHVMRKQGDCLEKMLMQGTTPGARARGRPRTNWLNNITSWTGLSMEQLARTVENRHQWRMVIHDAANPRIEDG